MTDYTPIPPTEWAYKVVDDHFEFGKMSDDGTVPDEAWEARMPKDDEAWGWDQTYDIYKKGLCNSGLHGTCVNLRRDHTSTYATGGDDYCATHLVEQVEEAQRALDLLTGNAGSSGAVVITYSEFDALRMSLYQGLATAFTAGMRQYGEQIESILGRMNNA
jgi:hypothetical protein